MPRCLIVERHPWETGFAEEQIQLPIAAFDQFFGNDGEIEVDIYGVRNEPSPTRHVRALLSAYTTSATRRLNRISEIGDLQQCFVFIQEIEQEGRVVGYELWWQPDVVAVMHRFSPWQQARGSQHRRGRFWTIVESPVDRTELV